MKTADGFEFEVGRTAWHLTDHCWHTPVTLIDGDKRQAIVVTTDGSIREQTVQQLVIKSMETWAWRERVAPHKAGALKGGV